ncbi:MAG: serine/threonine-protein kinase [Polyangiales bacterium]
MTDLARATASGADDSVFVGLERAGAGAMASVFRGTYLRSGRTVAVKRVLPALTHNEHITQMFADECRVHSTLDHPKVVRYVTHGRDADGAFLALEWVDGTSARSFVDPERKLTTGAAVAMALDVLDALDALHRGRAAKVGRSAILHRDISPANVLVGADGFARLADFGLARVFSFARTTPPEPPLESSATSSRSPRGAHAHDARRSVRARRGALGGPRGRALDGARERRCRARAKAFVIEPRRPLVSVRPTVSPAIAAVIDRALSLDPAQRFASAEAMASAVREAVSRDEWSKARDQLAMAARGGHVRRSRRRSTRSVN